MILDNFVKEHAEKFSFIPKEGISYKVFFKVSFLYSDFFGEKNFKKQLYIVIFEKKW